jgi:peroxiredoxin
MTGNRKQWSLVAGIVLALGIVLAVAALVRPQVDLVEPGKRAPSFTATDIRSDSVVSIESYRGKVVLLNIWATWCPPCRVEMPSMERVHRQFAGTDFRVVAVSVDADEQKVVEDFVKELGLTFDVVHDRTAEIQRIYQTTGVPESFVIDRNGVIMKKVIGPSEWDDPSHQSLIQRLLDVR